MYTMLSRHPGKEWLIQGDFILYRLKIEHILLIDAFGSAVDISIHEYYNVTPEEHSVNLSVPMNTFFFSENT